MMRFIQFIFDFHLLFFFFCGVVAIRHLAFEKLLTNVSEEEKRLFSTNRINFSTMKMLCVGIGSTTTLSDVVSIKTSIAVWEFMMWTNPYLWLVCLVFSTETKRAIVSVYVQSLKGKSKYDES